MTDHRKLVLIADDSLTCRISTAQSLSVQGFRVVFAKDGAEAVDVARAERPDLILMDVDMPRLDGIEAVRSIRAARIDCPIVMITTEDGVRSQLEASRAGANDYVIKGRPDCIRRKVELYTGLRGES